MVRVSLDNEPEVLVNGTYLMTFYRVTYVNINLRRHQKSVPQTVASARLNVTYHHSLLSLPFLHKLSEESTLVVVNTVAAAATCSKIGIVVIGILAFRRLRLRWRSLDVVQQVLENVGMARDEGLVNIG